MYLCAVLALGTCPRRRRFLVVDEADRMLAQSFHNWVNRVYESLFPPRIAWVQPTMPHPFYQVPLLVGVDSQSFTHRRSHTHRHTHIQ